MRYVPDRAEGFAEYSRCMWGLSTDLHKADDTVEAKTKRET